MQLIFGDFTQRPVYIATTNGDIKANGELVMGKGAAKVLSDMYPALPEKAGQVIKQNGQFLPQSRVWVYGFLAIPMLRHGVEFVMCGIFQTKFHWQGPADLTLIRKSTAKLDNVARAMPDKVFNLPFPGIGLGGLNAGDVEPIISILPDNVHVYILK